MGFDLLICLKMHSFLLPFLYSTPSSTMMDQLIGNLKRFYFFTRKTPLTVFDLRLSNPLEL